jgi:acyl-coenzyme A thioesterase PaaI-like protein
MKSVSDPAPYKTVEFSRAVITELMIPSYANFGGKIHGGILFSLMDKVAYVCAAKPKKSRQKNASARPAILISGTAEVKMSISACAGPLFCRPCAHY